YLTVKGPHLSYLNHTIVDGNDGMLIPGEIADLRVTITNLGTVSAPQVFANLSCSNPEINITDNNAYFGNVNPGSQATCSTNSFSLEVGDQIIYGSQIPVELNLYNSQGYDHTINFFLQIGEVRVTDPLGSDNYGYYIYDNGDAQYSLAPVYQWIEIDPYLGGGGTALNFSDNGDETGVVETVTVPFNIRFYGQRYNEVSICSNGWLAPGETDINSAMNWSIPGPNGPSPMIAPFWDDLIMSSGHVCYQYRSDLHAFIVEWSNLKNEYNTSYTETFQVIIYDPAYYPTPTGDSEIKIQYKEINNIDVGVYPAPGMTHVYHGQYATVGIEDHTGLDGLEYTFNNTYPTAAKELENQMALFITTRFGTITGPPEADLEISDLDFIMIQDDEDTGTIEISNTGENTLVYSVSSFYRQQDIISSGRDSGGPDDYGYEWIDSNETVNLAYSWRDIQGTGTYVSFTNNDLGTGLMSIGFTFNFYGTDYTQFRINPNGWIGFGSDYSYWSNTSLPSTSAPHPAIMPFWDDLYPQIGSNGGGNVYYQSNSDSLIVWFDDVRHYSDNSTYDFQAILYRNGRILYQYRDMNGTINSATVGIQAPGAGDALQVVYNNNYIEDELAVLISPPQSWMELSHDSGTLDPGESDLIEVNVNSFDLEEGEYNCILTVNTNDPANLHINIPVQLTVVPYTLDPPASVWSTVSGSEYQLNWEAVTGATAYLIYSSADPYAPLASWHLEAEITQGTSWTNGFDADMKFFKIIAIN
ncbi:MAG: hypothetical protein JW996_04960, partial [Candidatus Cloacimonetes bacterium]|nr:hypothetical protein [Candidatus Cloacimonadota bacterium]